MTALAERRVIPLPWEAVEQRPDVCAYLGAFDACVAAGGSDAPAFVTALREIAFAELVEAKSANPDPHSEKREP